MHDHQINFSGKFNLQWRGEKTLTFSQSDQFLPKGFWGQNVSNVTGILGKNGVGKTNILELLTYVLYTPKSLNTDYYLLIETEEEGLMIVSNFHYNIDKKIQNNIRLIDSYSFSKSNLKIAFLSNIVDGSKRYFPNGVFDLSATRDLSPFSSYRGNILNEIRFFDRTDHYNYGFQFPHEVEIKFPRLNSSQLYRYKKLEPFRRKISESKSRNTFKYWFLYFLLFDIIDETLKHKNKPQIFSDDRDAYIDDIFAGVDFDVPLPDLYRAIESLIPSISLKSNNLNNLFKLIRLIDRISEKSTPKHVLEGKRQLRSDLFIIPFDIHARDILQAYYNFVTQRGRINFSWHGISSGHRAFLNIYSKLYSIDDKIDNSNVLLLIDEGDLYFHPQWQKEYLNKLLIFLEEDLSSSNFQIVLTSHSPFIASDIPTSNLHLLYSDDEKDMNGDNEFQSFGANIHELYNNSFFISDGSIGSFANKKVSELISRIQRSNSISEKNEALKLIGDSFLHKYLKKNYLKDD